MVGAKNSDDKVEMMMMMLMMISHYYRRGFPPRMCGQVAMANKQMVLDIIPTRPFCGCDIFSICLNSNICHLQGSFILFRSRQTARATGNDKLVLGFPPIFPHFGELISCPQFKLMVQHSS